MFFYLTSIEAFEECMIPPFTLEVNHTHPVPSVPCVLILMFLGQWWWTCDTCVKGDMRCCFGRHTSIPQHLTNYFQKHAWFSIQAAEATREWGVLLHGQWCFRKWVYFNLYFIFVITWHFFIQYIAPYMIGLYLDYINEHTKNCFYFVQGERGWYASSQDRYFLNFWPEPK